MGTAVSPRPATASSEPAEARARSDDDLRSYARQASVSCVAEVDEAVFDRLVARMSYYSVPSVQITTAESLDVEERCRVMAPLLEHPPPVHPYATGSWGLWEGEQVLAGHRRRQHLWVAS